MDRSTVFNEHRIRPLASSTVSAIPNHYDSAVTALAADQNENHLHDVYLHIEDPA